MFPTSSRRHELLLRTRLAPPQVHNYVLSRPNVAALLREFLLVPLDHCARRHGLQQDHRACLAHTGRAPCFWYSLSETDADPQRFLSYLISAFSIRLPGLSDLPLAVLQERGSEGNMDAWKQALDALINALSDALAEPAI